MFVLALSVVLFQWPLAPKTFLLCWAWLEVPLSPLLVLSFTGGFGKQHSFTCCNSHKLLIGRDEFMIERFSIIIRWRAEQA